MTHFKSFSVFMLCLTLVPSTAHAFGKKRPKEPADTLAYPARYFSMGTIKPTPFLLPDGTTPVDMSVALPGLVRALIQDHPSGKLRVLGGFSDNPELPPETPPRFVFEGQVTSFEASLFQGRIKFGYKPGVGDIGEGWLGGAEGEVKVNVGALGVAFWIKDLERGGEVVASAMGDALAGSGSVEVAVNFSVIQTGADFVMHPQMSKVFKKAIDRALTAMVNDPDTNFRMDWSAQIKFVDRDLKQVHFNSGMRDLIAPNNVFKVYDDAARLVGILKVKETDHESSMATFKDDADLKKLNSIRQGDEVKIHFTKIPRRGD